MGEYGDGRSTSSRDGLSDIAMRFIDEYSVLFVCSMNHIPPYIIHVCHDNTTMTSETSENTIRFSVLGFDLVLVYPMLANRVMLAFFTSFKWKTSNSFPTIFIFSDFTIRIVNCQSAF